MVRKKLFQVRREVQVIRALELLQELRQRKVRIQVSEGKLRVQAPKGALDAALRQHLKECKAELMELLEAPQGETGPGSGAAPILALPRGEAGPPLPLSPAQERLWILDRLEPGLTAYNVPVPVRLEGPLDRWALLRSLIALAQRHEVLRSAFPSHGGLPRLEILPVARLAPRWVDLSGLEGGTGEAVALDLARRDASTAFPLTSGPLARFTLVCLGEDLHLLLLNLHHAVTDGESMGLLLRELGLLYAEGPAALPPLTVQYADFAAWQRRGLEGEGLQRHLRQWQRHLEGAPGQLALLPDHARPPVQSFAGGRRWSLLPSSLVDAVESWAAVHQATPFMAWLTIFGALLARYSGQQDLLLGTAVSHRSEPVLEGLVGFFVNLLPLRCRTSPGSTGDDLLKHFREEFLWVFQHQDVPFERLVETLEIERDLQRPPLFQVVFTFQAAALTPPDLGAVKITPLELEDPAAKFELAATVERGEDGWGALVEYNADLFEPTTAERLLAHFHHLAEGIVASPGKPLDTVPLLSAAERQQLVNPGSEGTWVRVPGTEEPQPLGVAGELVRPDEAPSGLAARRRADDTVEILGSLEDWWSREETPSTTSSLASEEPTTILPPTDAVESKLLALWQELLQREDFGVEGDFFALGGHSLLAVRMMAQVEEDFAEAVPVSALFEAPTVAALAERLRSSSSPAEEDSPLVLLQAGSPGERPVFLFHPVGGEVFCYRSLVAALRSEVPVYGVRRPESFPLDLDLPTLAERYRQAISTIENRAPYRLGGWSMGAVLAYEVAQGWLAEGEAVEWIALLDPPPPNPPELSSDTSSVEKGQAENDPGEEEAELWLSFLGDFAATAATGGGFPPLPSEEELASWAALPQADQRAAAASWAAARGLLPPDRAAAVLEARFRRYRSHRTGLHRYSSSPWPGDGEARCHLWIAEDSRVAEAAAGWQRLGGVAAVHEVPGDHYSVVLQPGESLKATLGRLWGDPSQAV